MRATQILREEHRWIRHLLDCLQELVAREEFDSKAAGELQALFEGFVDGQHQRKEEAVLFPRLLERVQALQEDHVREREHLERMRFSLFNATLGDPAGQREFADEAQAYLVLQRRHLEQENLGLLPLAEHLLAPSEDPEVVAELQRCEADGPDRDDVRERVLRLCEHLDVVFERSVEPVA